jgi:signal transduction histidine kinase
VTLVRSLRPEWELDTREELAKLRSERAALLGSIAAKVAHEFNNVLTVVLSSLDQLRRQPLDERGQQQLERAEWGARQTTRLAEQVLAFMRNERAEPQVVDVNAVTGASIGCSRTSLATGWHCGRNWLTRRY